MPASQTMSTEERRLNYLNSFRLNKKQEHTLNELTELACKLTGAASAVISIVEKDVVWFKSQHQIHLKKQKRENTLFDMNLKESQGFLYCPDLKASAAYKRHQPLSIHGSEVVSYAGVSLESLDKRAIGTLSIMDHHARELTEEQCRSLKMVAHLVMSQLRLRKRNLELSETSTLLKEKNELLTQFAHVVSHDMKMPLANMVLTADVLRKKYGAQLDQGAHQYIDSIKESAFNLSDYVGDILAHYESDNMLKDEKDITDIYTLLENVSDLLVINDTVQFKLPENNLTLICNNAALTQIFLNLIGNSLKYNDKEHIEISVHVIEDESHYIFEIVDNGTGIPEDKIEDVFKLFMTLGTLDRHGKKGNGIGLSTVHKLVTNMGGTIQVQSKINEGTQFKFSILK